MKIAVFGKMRSGKDTVGAILIDEYNFIRFAFGDGIGKIIQEYFPEDWAKGKPRKHYQHIGQQLRELNPDVWIDYLLRTVEKYEGNCSLLGQCPKNIIVTDGRQKNEAEKLKAQGYTIIKIVADEKKRIERIIASGDKFKYEQLFHETELQVDEIEADYVIYNNGSFKELKDNVQKIINELQGGGA